MNNNFNVNSARTIFGIALLASITPSAVLLGPLVVGALVENLGFLPQYGGNMIFAELGGAALATFPALWWVKRLNWRTVLYVALAITISGNIVSSFLIDPWLLGFCRFYTGLGVGSIMLVTLTSAGLTENQERVFGFWMTGQIVFAAVALAIMPSIIPAIGIKGFYICLAIVMALLVLVVRWLPEGGQREPDENVSQASNNNVKLAVLALIGLSFFFIAVGGVWNFIERIGNGAGFDSNFIAYTLSAVSVAGVTGALFATWLNTKLGRIIPFVFGIVVLAISFGLLYGISSQTTFIVSAFLFKFGWWFISPYLLANMTALDPSGRLITLTNFAIAAGQASGPLIVGFMLVKTPTGFDYTPSITVGLVCFAVCCVFFIPVTYVTNKLLKNNK